MSKVTDATDDYEDSKAYRRELEDAISKLYDEPRQWGSLDEVPHDVAVYDAGGYYWSFWSADRKEREWKISYDDAFEEASEWLSSHSKVQAGSKLPTPQGGSVH